MMQRLGQVSRQILNLNKCFGALEGTNLYRSELGDVGVVALLHVLVHALHDRLLDDGLDPDGFVLTHPAVVVDEPFAEVNQPGLVVQDYLGTSLNRAAEIRSCVGHCN